jgi:hypothetical protein
MMTRNPYLCAVSTSSLNSSGLPNLEAIEKKFDERGSGWLAFAAVTVVTIILGVLACYFIGDILTYVDGFITFMNGI